MSKQIKFGQKIVRPGEQLVDQVEQKMATWIETAVGDVTAPTFLTRENLALCLKQAYLAGVETGIETGITAVNSLSPFAGILHDAKEGLLVRN